MRNENVHPRIEKPYVPEVPKRIVTLGYETDRARGILRLKRCDGEQHWYEEQADVSGVNDNIIPEIIADNLNQSVCDCPDKKRRKDVMDIFKN